MPYSLHSTPDSPVFLITWYRHLSLAITISMGVPNLRVTTEHPERKDIDAMRFREPMRRCYSNTLIPCKSARSRSSK